MRDGDEWFLMVFTAELAFPDHGGKGEGRSEVAPLGRWGEKGGEERGRRVIQITAGTI